MVAVVRIDAELPDDLEGVFAPVLDVDEGVVQRRAVVAGEGIDLAEDLGGSENVGGDDLVEEAGELAISEADAVEGIEFLAEILLKGGAVADVRAILVFQTEELFDEIFLKLLFECRHLRSMFRYCWNGDGRGRGTASQGENGASIRRRLDGSLDRWQATNWGDQEYASAEIFEGFGEEFGEAVEEEIEAGRDFLGGAVGKKPLEGGIEV